MQPLPLNRLFKGGFPLFLANPDLIRFPYTLQCSKTVKLQLIQTPQLSSLTRRTMEIT